MACRWETALARGHFIQSEGPGRDKGMGENRMEAGKEPSNLWLRASQIYNNILPQCTPSPASHWAVHGLAPGHKTCSGCCRESQSPGEPRVVFKPCVPSPCAGEVFLPGKLPFFPSLSFLFLPSPSSSFVFLRISFIAATWPSIHGLASSPAFGFW